MAPDEDRPTPSEDDAGVFGQPDDPERRLPDPLPTDPFPLFTQWFEEARQQRVQPNPDAMTLATVDPDGSPSARIVLCKAIHPDPGFVVFYTNYRSRKGDALERNPRAALVLHWDTLDRQVRIEGPVTRSPAAESDAYFRSRPWFSRIGAWASDQSKPAESPDTLTDSVIETLERFGINPLDLPETDADIDIPRPPHWGGYRVWAQRIELWVGATARLHDRAAWVRSLEPTDTQTPGYRPAGEWTATRLYP